MKIKKVLSAICAASLLLGLLSPSVLAAESRSYTLSSPYESVDWSRFKSYKTGLHTHSSVSDGSESFRNMIYGAYEQNYDILSFSEHGITGKAWDKDPYIRPLYLYQPVLGYDRKPLSTDEFEAILNGTAAVSSTGAERGRGMYCLKGSNELNAVTITKAHVNGYFLPEDVGNMDWGMENGYDYALSMIEKNGGISHINHPGDILGTRENPDAVNDPENIKFFADFLLRYKSCLGVESVNGFQSLTRHDRVFWDNLLMECLPYGKTVYGFAGSDAHNVGRLNTCFMYFMLEEVSDASIRECMENGAFFGATHSLAKDDLIGPFEDFLAPEGVDQPLARVNELTVSGHKIKLNLSNADYVNWISNGKIIAKTEVNGNGVATLNVDDYYTDEMLYVRCEIYNENGMVFSQPITIEKSDAPKEYSNEKTQLEQLIFALKSTKLYVLFEMLVKAIKNK